MEYLAGLLVVALVVFAVLYVPEGAKKRQRYERAKANLLEAKKSGDVERILDARAELNAAGKGVVMQSAQVGIPPILQEDNEFNRELKKRFAARRQEDCDEL